LKDYAPLRLNDIHFSYTAREGILSHPKNKFYGVIFRIFLWYTQRVRAASRLSPMSPYDCPDRIPYTDLLALDDERVMQHLQKGNTDAFAVVFKRYHRLVHVTALHILRDAAEAEDVTQSVFLEIYRNAGQFDPARGTLKVWLLQYAYSRSTNRLNYLLVRHVYNKTEVSAIDEAEGFWSPTRLQPQETSRLTAEALEVLPHAQRQTIKMFFFEGLDFKEIARRRNEKFSSVRHHYYRGLQRLRLYLEQNDQQSGKARAAMFLERGKTC
jgi:RNA polymerase sigma-70 factor, ECF subfamily